jgi:filamentous hemagglutinin family protein
VYFYFLTEEFSMKRTLLKQTLLAASLMGVGFASYAELPQGGVINRGAAGSSITYDPNGNLLTVNQGQNAIMTANWASFNIGAGKAVNFVQPNAQAIALNRVMGTTASTISGTLTANGQVFLINQNGILFGQTAQVNVGGLVATTRNIEDAVLTPNGAKSFSGSSIASIENKGVIKTNANGASHIILAGHKVLNSGTIDTYGKIALIGGGGFTIYSDPLGNNGKYLDIGLHSGDSTAEVSNSGNVGLIPAGGFLPIDPENIDIKTTGSVINTSKILGRVIKIEAGQNINNSNWIWSNDNMTLNATNNIVNSGLIRSNSLDGVLEINANNLINSDTITIYRRDNAISATLKIRLRNDLINTGSYWNTAFTADCSNFVCGGLHSGTNLEINAGRDIINDGGDIKTRARFDLISGRNIHNFAGLIQGGFDFGSSYRLNMEAANDIYNAGVMWHSNANVTAKNITNQGSIAAFNSLKLNAGTIKNNSGASIVGGGGGTVINVENLLENHAGGGIFNTDGIRGQHGSVSIKSNKDIINTGYITAHYALDLTANNDFDNSGKVAGADVTNITATNNLKNTGVLGQGNVYWYGDSFRSLRTNIKAFNVVNSGEIHGNLNVGMNVFTLSNLSNSGIFSNNINIKADEGVSNAGVIGVDNRGPGNSRRVGESVVINAGRTIYNAGAIGHQAYRTSLRAGTAIFNLRTGIIGSNHGQTRIDGGGWFNDGAILRLVTDTGGGTSTGRRNAGLSLLGGDAKAM